MANIIKLLLFSLFSILIPTQVNSINTPVIIVHGGAGTISDSRVEGSLEGVRAAVTAGYQVLMAGGSALDAVEAAVNSMEEDERFNAGYGSVLNIRGEVAMDASIMSGADLNAGAVTLITDFLHPISIAHKVLTESPHTFLAGEGAKIFALEQGFEEIPPESLITQNARDALQNYLQSLESGREWTNEGGVGTVGAVALDMNGHIAAATSTGGLTGKAVGRVGDSPIIGSGTYADDNIGGISATGHGESIMKYGLARNIINFMESGLGPTSATRAAIDAMTSRLNNTAGAITLSKNGDVGLYFSTQRMSWAYAKNNEIHYGVDFDPTLEDENSGNKAHSINYVFSFYFIIIIQLLRLSVI